MCPKCRCPEAPFVKSGFYPRQSGQLRRIQRFRCYACGHRFSTQSTALTRGERKPHLTIPLMRMLARGVSQRASAVAFGIHPSTVARKLVRLGARAGDRLAEAMPERTDAKVVVFDEMETFEHSKCKPVAIALAVVEGTRHVIAVKAASMPAKGPLAAIARRRYGRRSDRRAAALRSVLGTVRRVCPAVRIVKSDQCPRYPKAVLQVLSGVTHVTFKGRRGCVVGQGELKAGGFDPLFSLNHTCAMFRDRVKRLSRRTWCTTKRIDRLQALLNVYAWVHNETLRGAGRLVTL